jgi:hypothetical protein
MSLMRESKYSPVKVAAFAVILGIAFLPLVGILHTRPETGSSNYATARVLAEEQLELTQSLPYDIVETSFPNAPCIFDVSGLCEASNRMDLHGEFPEFRYTVLKQYVRPSADGSGLVDADTDRGMMRVTVVVGRDGTSFDESIYTASTIKKRET